MTSVSADVLSPASAPAASPAVVLTIAGSEATGGAGAQADLKTFQELGVFGIANLTCIVSFDPNDNWNHRFVPLDQQVIADQLEATTAAYVRRQARLRCWAARSWTCPDREGLRDSRYPEQGCLGCAV
jgi:pyridoxine kinase